MEDFPLSFLSLLLMSAGLFFAARRLLTYLHGLQQDDYDNGRFLRWLFRTRSLDRRATLGLVALSLLDLTTGLASHETSTIIVALLLAFIAFREPDPRDPKTTKKKLVMTARATRIFGVGLALLLPLVLALGLAEAPAVWWILLTQGVPFALALGNLLLTPVERLIQKRYAREARAKLARLAPTVIGITGSFGKTSLKHILGHILQMTAPTLITPGSVNTPMGISRIIREKLEPCHRYFIVEMGAYGPGSIARLCALTPPGLGIVTAIGLAHYERFRSLDTVAEAKFELAEAVATRNGPVFIPESVLDFGAVRAFRERLPDTLRTTGGAKADLTIENVAQDAKGLRVGIRWKGESFTLQAPVWGAPQAGNLALAFLAATHLGLTPETILVALRSLPQIAHRLEVKPQPNGAILVDDAFNSNPVGFAGALDILSLLKPEGGRRILVTPGIVELGAAHDATHAELGAKAAAQVDILLPVMPERFASFTEAFRRNAPAAQVVPCASFAEARAWMAGNVRANDIVLLENDLPDLYERKLRL